jgi:hypothetical protein
VKASEKADCLENGAWMSKEAQLALSLAQDMIFYNY